MLEAALRALLDANTLEGTATQITQEQWEAVVKQALVALGEAV